ncbi:MAG TPA: ABC transporter permease [Stellaceae bacterium]|nr:ABC transporter permease [Stellaceae bacterium]
MAEVGVIAVKPEAPAPAAILSQGYWALVRYRLLRDRTTLVCGAILLVIILAAIFAPYLAPADPYKTSMLRRLQPVFKAPYLIGSDELGRDMLSRLIYGGRLSLVMGITPVLNALIIGGALGIVAGYLGGAVNMAIMRLVDVLYAFPSILLAIAIAGALGTGLTNSIVALTIVFVPQVARVAETVTTQVRGLDYVDAARASGASTWAILRVHVLGNVLGPIFVYATGLISVSIILASGLSFIGLGVKPPEPEWGLMLNTLRQSIFVNPTVAALPGAMIFMTSMAFNLMSDGLRAAMDVKA